MHSWFRPWFHRLSGGALVAASYGLAGCGLQVPTLEPLASSQLEVGQVVTNIASHIGCEIGNAVSAIHTRYKSENLARQIAWLDNWAAKVTLQITVEEKTVVAPGISFRTLFPNASTVFGAQTITTAQAFSFGIGGQFSSGATRTETVGYFVSLGALRRRVEAGMAQTPPKKCPTGVGPNIEGDLKFGEWLEATILPLMTPGAMADASVLSEPPTLAVNDPDPKAPAAPATVATRPEMTLRSPPLDVISHQVNFVITVGGNITPTWTLVTFAANTGNTPLLGATRTRTNNVLVTMGPTINTASGIQPSQGVEFQHLASQIKNVPVIVP